MTKDATSKGTLSSKPRRARVPRARFKDTCLTYLPSLAASRDARPPECGNSSGFRALRGAQVGLFEPIERGEFDIVASLRHWAALTAELGAEETA
jgi:hypothetical protein